MSPRALIPAEMPTDSVTFKIDLREVLAYEFPGFKTCHGTLAAGDYTVDKLENQIAIERKSLPDLLSCMAGERDRFERELQRLLAYPTRCVVVEASWGDLERGEWRSKVSPKSATGSVLAWIGAGVPFLLAGNRVSAQQATARLLYSAARRRYRELRGLLVPAAEAEPEGATA